MADYIHLIGADKVESAGHAMADAATRMQQAASQIEESHRQHQRFMDDWLRQFGDAAIRLSGNSETKS